MIVRRRVGIGCFLAILVAGCKRAPPADPARASAPRASAPFEITIVGTADLHGRLWRLPLLGGYLKALRAARPGRVVVVDAGDVFQGTLESDPNEGAVAVRAYRALGYHAVAIGNHEFDYGPEGPAPMPRLPGDDPRGALKARARQAEGAFPLLAANLLVRGRPPAWRNVRASTLVPLPAGVRVGIVGVTTSATTRTTLAANVAGIETTPLAEAIAREAAALRRAGAHIVVVAAHAGGRCRDFSNPNDLSSCDDEAEIFAVARALPRGSIDAIVAGHTHAAVAHVVSGIPIAQAWSLGRGFGRIDLTWDPAGGRVVGARVHPPTRMRKGAVYEGVTVVPDPAVAGIVREARRAARRLRRNPLGVVLARRMRRHYSEESPLGNFVASMMLEVEPRARVAIANAGGLRADLPAGPLRYGALYDALPFENRLARVTLRGARLRELVARNLASRHGVFSFAGARVAARCRGGALEVDVRLEGAAGGSRPIRDDEEITIVTSDFLATGGDGFPRGDHVEMTPDSPSLREAIAARLRARGGRIDPEAWYAPDRPRLSYPGRRPIRCRRGR